MIWGPTESGLLQNLNNPNPSSTIPRESKEWNLPPTSHFSRIRIPDELVALMIAVALDYYHTFL